MSRSAGARAIAALLVALALASCAKNPRAPDVTAGTSVDSATVALWRLDESVGTRAADAGPSRIDGTAGVDTRATFGRVGQARMFSRSNDSFLYVPYNAALDLPSSFTIEAWVEPSAYSPYEASPIAVRWWPQTAEESWIFAIVGSNLDASQWPTDLGTTTSGPGWLASFVSGQVPGHLLFVYQPREAGSPRAFVSQSAVELDRWTHVAVSFDGQVLRFWLDGQPDGTFASVGGVRRSQAPVLVGNLFDTRLLSDFGGDLRQPPGADTRPYYAFEGAIDELRLSNVARSQFPVGSGR